MMALATPCGAAQPGAVQRQQGVQRSQSTDELHRSQVNMHSLHARVSQLEKLSRDSVEVQTRHEHWWKATQGQLDKLQAQLAQQEDLRDALKDQLSDLVAKSGAQLSAQHLSLKEKLDYLDILVNQSGQGVSEELEAIRAAQAKLAGETESADRDRRAEMEERLADSERAFRDLLTSQEALKVRRALQAERRSQLEERLDSIAGDQVRGLEAASAQVEQLREAVRGPLQNEQRAREAQCTLLSDELAKEQAVREQAVTSLQLRVENIRKLLGTSPDRQAWQPGNCKAHPTCVIDRLQMLERATSEHVEEARSHHDSFHSALADHQERHVSVVGRLSGLEKSGLDAAQVSSQELARHRAALDETASRLQELSGVEVSVAALFQHLEQVEVGLERSEAAHAQALQNGLGKLEGTVVEELQQQQQAQAQLVDQQHQAMLEKLAGETRSRDALEKAIQFHLVREQQARAELEEICDGTKEDLRNTRATLTDALAEEASARGRFQELTQEQLFREQALRQSLEEWQQNQQLQLEDWHQHQLQLEELYAQEKSERFKQHQRIHGRLDAHDRIRGTSPHHRTTVLYRHGGSPAAQSLQNLSQHGSAAGGGSDVGGEHGSPDRRSQPEVQAPLARAPAASPSPSDAILGRFVLNSHTDREKERISDRPGLMSGLSRSPPSLR